MISRDIVLKPNDSLENLTIKTCAGSLAIDRKNVRVAFSGNKNLKVKLQATGAFMKMNSGVNSTLIQFPTYDHGVENVEIKVSSVEINDNIYIAVFNSIPGMTVPEFKLKALFRQFRIEVSENPAKPRNYYLDTEEETIKTVKAFVDMFPSLEQISFIVVGFCALVAIISIIVCCICKCRKKREPSMGKGLEAL